MPKAGKVAIVAGLEVRGPIVSTVAVAREGRPVRGGPPELVAIMRLVKPEVAVARAESVAAAAAAAVIRMAAVAVAEAVEPPVAVAMMMAAAVAAAAAPRGPVIFKIPSSTKALIQARVK